MADLRSIAMGLPEDQLSVTKPSVESEPSSNLLAQAIIGLAPLLAGAALSGARGGAIGGEAGLAGLSQLTKAQQLEQERKAQMKKEERAGVETALRLKSEARLAASEERKAKAEERKFAQESALNKEKLAFEKEKFQAEMGTGKKQLALLSPDNKIMVEKLSEDSAKKTAIANEITSAVKIFDDPTVSDTQKIKAGQALLKTLNSTQGSDAVGVEEARRLGSFLEWTIRPFPESGKKIGRDLPGFRDQAASTVNRLASSIEINKSVVQNAMAGIPTQVKKIPLKEETTWLPEMPSAQAAPKPKMIQQGGHVYKLNEATGEYE